MKIIKNGHEKTYIATCVYCDSDIEHTMQDTFKYNHDIISPFDNHIMRDKAIGIKCPVCGNTIFITFDFG